MTSGLVNASFSLAEWQAVEMIFFALCHLVKTNVNVSPGTEMVVFNKTKEVQRSLVQLK